MSRPREDGGSEISNEKPKAPISRRDLVRTGATGGLGATALARLVKTHLDAQGNQQDWDMTVDVVIAGAGISGLSTAIEARDHGASVIIVEENYDCGGHGMVSGRNVNLGGGRSRQRRHGVEDSPDQVFADWICPQPYDTRFTDRYLVPVYADLSAETFEWMVANGVQFVDTVAGRDLRNGPTIQ